MLNAEDYLTVLQDGGISFFCGVPDSLLKQICACITDTLSAKDHIITANEGAAVGLAIGYHLATGEVPLVYMQNSGLGNVVNPFMSLASPEVYGIPVVMLIGWRGRPGVKDEPQHVHQGRVTQAMLDSMDIPYVVLSDDIDTAREDTKSAIAKAKETNGSVAILVKKGTFDAYKMTHNFPDFPLEREEAIIEIANSIEANAAVVCTTGMPSRELFEHRARTGARHETDFLTVGGMGHASQIALGMALQQSNRPIYCIDGDGAALMHMGSLTISGTNAGSNFTHFIVNNGAHESVGGQPTVGLDIDFPAIAKASGYNHAVRVTTAAEIKSEIENARTIDGPVFIEVLVKAGHRIDIGRPTTTPAENKAALMAFLKS
ncbi:MAG: phosphonopyruvate decarboxylase [Acidimicrobiales bacterium]|nr:phosphonopyruvate decarboxylase [Hyphomonadaceae bacterium]RZV43159.1 MAG: phosphonopyruvate decarboxylase [Acidimicrobiales bacterium]